MGQGSALEKRPFVAVVGLRQATPDVVINNVKLQIAPDLAYAGGSYLHLLGFCVASARVRPETAVFVGAAYPHRAAAAVVGIDYIHIADVFPEITTNRFAGVMDCPHCDAIDVRLYVYPPAKPVKLICHECGYHTEIPIELAISMTGAERLI